jgi:hypothetical protein
MKPVTLSVPELAFVAATRGIGGAGIALLLADCLSTSQRKRLGLALLAVGVLTTVPIARKVLARRAAGEDDASDEAVDVLSG